MNTLLIFFAFPIAVIIFSVLLQKLLHNPFAVAAIIFAIFIVVTFSAFDETFLIATLAYTILAFITALLTDRLFNNHHNCHICNSNSQGDADATTCLCNALTDTLENNNNNTNNVIDGLLDLLQNNNNNNNDDNTDTCDTAATTTASVPNDDNVISNNCGYMYNRRCRRF